MKPQHQLTKKPPCLTKKIRLHDESERLGLKTGINYFNINLKHFKIFANLFCLLGFLYIRIRNQKFHFQEGIGKKTLVVNPQINMAIPNK